MSGPRPAPAGRRAVRPPGPARRIATAVALLLVTGVVALAVGVPAATVDGSLGPHNARYSALLRPYVWIDLGPVGSIYLDSPFPLGVEVRVQEIPAGLSAGGQDPVQALGADLEGYVQFFAEPGLAVEEALGALARDALRRVVLVWSLLLVGVAAARIVFRHGPTHAAIRNAAGRPGVAALLTVAAAGSVAVVAREYVASAPPEGSTSPVLAETVLADARIVGRVGELLDTYGPYAIDVIEENAAFYEAATANLAAAYPPDASDERPGEPDRGVADPGDVDQVEPDPDADPEASPAPTGPTAAPVEAEPADVREAVTVLFVSDLHCNVGMTDVIGEAVRRSGATVVLNGGDTVISGTSVEQFCVDALARALPAGVRLVVADGNHDTELTSQQQRRAGAVVLTGEVVVVGGLRILGDADPAVTEVAAGNRARDGYPDRATQAARLTQRACEAQEAGRAIDILMVHNPRIGVGPMASGCVPLQLSGHFHRSIGPTQQGLGLLYVTGSVAGATAGQPTIGPLRSPGTLTVLRIDPMGNGPLDHRLITVGTDAGVEVGPWLPFPDPAVKPVVAELGWSDPAA